MSLLSRLINGLIRFSPWIALTIAFFPLFAVMPLTQWQLGAHGCVVEDMQIVTCTGLGADETTIRMMNNGLVFSLWGLLLTVPVGVAIYFGSIWAKHMAEIYFPQKRKERPPLFKGE